jgi:hypothetical protein
VCRIVRHLWRLMLPIIVSKKISLRRVTAVMTRTQTSL